MKSLAESIDLSTYSAPKTSRRCFRPISKRTSVAFFISVLMMTSLSVWVAVQFHECLARSAPFLQMMRPRSSFDFIGEAAPSDRRRGERPNLPCWVGLLDKCRKREDRGPGQHAFSMRQGPQPCRIPPTRPPDYVSWGTRGVARDARRNEQHRTPARPSHAGS